MRIDSRKLLLIMAEKETSVDGLCKASGVARTSIYRLTHDAGDVRPATAGKLAHALGVDVTDLITE